MIEAIAYLFLKSNRYRGFIKSHALGACLFLVSIMPSIAYAQQDESYDEISVTLNVQRIGSVEVPAVIRAEHAYLPVKDIFEFLKIKCSIAPDLDSINGFFINPKATFAIDRSKSRIVYQDKIFELKSTDFIRTETNLYIKSNYLGEVFGLDCSFNFRSLSVTINTQIELPAIREMQQEQVRRNLSKLKGEKKADTIINRSFSWFNWGVADWAVTSMQSKVEKNTRINLGLGAQVAGGEANINLLYNSNAPFDWRQQFYKWRYVNNNSSVLRQVTVGKLFTSSTSSVFAPVTGVQFTNTPTTYKKSFGTFILSNTTKPGWMVELYVNNVMVNYTKADASGFFTFEMPMIYGNSAIKLRFYGPWGEEETREQNISIPFNFVPAGQFEYTVTAGVAENDEKSKFSRANFNYGLGRRITIGAGMEYLSSLVSGKSMPFATASLRLGSNILVSGEHIYGVRSKGNINYRLPSNLQMDLTYIKYNEGQVAVKYNYLEEKKAVFSMPFRGRKFSTYSRLTLNQFTFQTAKGTPGAKNTSAELLVSGVVSGISSNLTTNALFIKDGRSVLYSSLSLAFRLPSNIRFTPQLQYDYSSGSFNNLKAEVEKPVFKKGYLNISCARSIIDKNTSVSLGLRYNFSFAQTSVTALHSNNTFFTAVSAKGSLLYDGRSGNMLLQEQSNQGRGGLIISAFLDLNSNGRKDVNEPKVSDLNLRVNGGKMETNYYDTTTWVSGLEAYNNYFIEMDKSSFENVAWQIKKPIISVAIEPNRFKIVEIPIAVMGEASGTVNVEGASGTKGIGRIIVNFYDVHNNLISRTLTESDGYFSYLGLAPGLYKAQIDEAQLTKLVMSASPAIVFTVRSSKDGDVADGLRFVLKNTAPGK